MKIIAIIARFLLGFIFLVFALNGFLHFLPASLPSGTAGQFVGALFVSHGKDSAYERLVRRHFPSYLPNERRSPAAREIDARDRAARDACGSSCANRARA